MRKNIDIDDTTLTKLKIISAFENLSVKALMEGAVRFFVEHKEKERYESLTDEEKEDAKLSNKGLKQKLKRVIIRLENEKSLRTVPNCIKVQNHSSAYRIRIGDYRCLLYTSPSPRDG